jgi:opacity protein-like surface antigen
MTRRILILLAATCLFASVAEAQMRHRMPSREGRWDFGLQTRYTTSRTYDGQGGSSIDLQDDLGWGFGIGYNVNQRFNLGLLFTWRSINYDATGVDPDDPENTVRYNGRLDTSTVGITGDWNILEGDITPYVNGGIAWMLIDTNIFAGYTTGCWWDPWWGYICGNYASTYGVSTAAFSIGAGCRIHLSEAVFTRIGYEYGWSDLESTRGSNMLRIDIGLMN